MAELVATAANAAASVDVESKIRAAIHSRVPYFREQADSLTFVGVRRVLEEDLGLEKYALDPRKRFVKDYLVECLEAANDGQVSNSAEGDGGGAKFVRVVPSEKDNKESNTAGGQIMRDCPVLGLMTGNRKTKVETDETQQVETDVLSEIKINEAISKGASHLKENSRNITMAEVRRLLEEDVKLEKYALDPFKKFICDQMNEKKRRIHEGEKCEGYMKECSLNKMEKQIRKEGEKKQKTKQTNEETSIGNGKSKRGFVDLEFNRPPCTNFDEFLAREKAIEDIVADDRDWRILLTEERLRSNGFWDSVVYYTGTWYPLPSRYDSYLLLLRSFEFLNFELVLFPSLSEAKRSFARRNYEQECFSCELGGDEV
ncbi:hypothetical protein Dimus_006291 [Dionaea muscipula]